MILAFAGPVLPMRTCRLMRKPSVSRSHTLIESTEMTDLRNDLVDRLFCNVEGEHAPSIASGAGAMI